MTGVTLISRIFGLVRTILIAHFMGTTVISDAFAIAFKIPNLFRRLVAEGSLTAAFIPVFTDVSRRSQGDIRGENEFISLFHKVFGIFLSLFCLLGVLFSPFLVYLLYGFSEKSPEVTVFLTRIMFPYVGFVSLASVATSVLNVRGYFAYPAAMPIVMNATVILGGYFGWPLVSPEWTAHIVHTQEPALVFAAQVAIAMSVCILISGFFQWSFQWPLLFRLGYKIIHTPMSFKDPEIIRIFKLMIPGVFSLGIYQINALIADPFALAYLKSGAIAALNFSNRLLEFSLGVFIVSISTVIFPSLSRHVSQGDMQAYGREFKRGVCLTLWIAIPSTAGLILLAEPIVRLIFQNGLFTQESVVLVKEALVWHAAGLPVIGISRVYTPAFFSFKDTRSPVAGAFFGLVINLVGCMVLPPIMGIGGIAAASTLAALATLVYMVIKFKQYSPGISGRFMIMPTLSMSAISLLMGLCIYLVLPWLDTGSRIILCIRLMLLIGAAGVLYTGLTYVFRLGITSDLNILWKRKP